MGLLVRWTQNIPIILQNGDTAVVLVTHSMGSIMTLYFLHQQTQVTKMMTVVWFALLKLLIGFMIFADNYPNFLSTYCV